MKGRIVNKNNYSMNDKQEICKQTNFIYNYIIMKSQKHIRFQKKTETNIINEIGLKITKESSTGW